MKNLREVAERICGDNGILWDKTVKESVDAVESVLKEVAIQEGEAAVRICDIVHKKQLEEARSSALEEAALIVEKEHKFCEPPMCEIANKIRALMGGG